MAAWLAQQIAQQTGISANLRFPLPARFIWELFSSQLDDIPDQAIFGRPVLVWRIVSLLPRLAGEREFADLAIYLDNDSDSIRLFQLAGRIANLFDQYLVYRPDMLLAWEQGDGSGWQEVLWRRLTEGTARHRARLSHEFLHLAASGNLDPATLPRRVVLFGLNSLAPVYLEILVRLSTRVDVHLFHLNPCRQFWGDLISEKALARKKGDDTDSRADGQYLEMGHPLLSSLGQVGQVFFSQLLEYDCQEEDLYVEPDNDTLLAGLQQDILDLRDRSREEDSRKPFAPDHSIQFHVCHSPVREIQVLHNRLLDCFAELPGLRPGDVVVMAPDITRYRGAVQAVFGTADEQLYIPWHMADLSPRLERGMVHAFLVLLAMPGSRYTAHEVLSLLETEAIRNRFTLTEEDLVLIRRRLDEAGVRWGLDALQRKRQGLDIGDLHSWEFGLSRLFLGYVMGGEESGFREIVPCSGISGGDPSWLGNLASYIDSLARLDGLLARSHTADRWQEILLGLLDDFFLPVTEQDEDALGLLRDQILAFAEECGFAGYREAIPGNIIYALLRSRLDEPAGGRAFLSGKVTFCNMVPMRTLPFRVVCLLGMNDADFPRIDRPLAFDLMARQPRPGDRCRRNDDRYLFLEAILSARDILYISWQGRDQLENRELPPSVVVGELRDYLDRSYAPVGAASEKLTWEHPLQPFSPRCFTGSGALSSYDDRWLSGMDRPPVPVFLAAPLSDPDRGWQTMELDRFVRFWTHPVRFFLQERLGLLVREKQDWLEDSEPFVLDPLQRYLLAGQVTARTLVGSDGRAHLALLQRTGALPHGPFGTNLQEELAVELDRLHRRIVSSAGRELEPVEVTCRLDRFVLQGWLDGLTTLGLVSWRPAKVNAVDLFRLWVRHLVLQLIAPKGMQPVSLHLGMDQTVRFVPVPEPLEELNRLAQVFWQGLCTPLHFYPKTSYAWVLASAGRKEQAAASCWYGSPYQRGECDDPAYRIALRGQEALDASFVSLAALFEPLLEHIEEVDDASS